MHYFMPQNSVYFSYFSENLVQKKFNNYCLRTSEVKVIVLIQVIFPTKVKDNAGNGETRKTLFFTTFN